LKGSWRELARGLKQTQKSRRTLLFATQMTRQLSSGALEAAERATIQTASISSISRQCQEMRCESKSTKVSKIVSTSRHHLISPRTQKLIAWELLSLRRTDTQLTQTFILFVFCQSQDKLLCAHQFQFAIRNLIYSRRTLY
jgi:23S rRNA C2498 (ribose-2'-O)-methylase RlmM